MLFVFYGIMVLCVIFFSVKCAYYLDLIEAKTNLSGVFLSGVILAGITSLPELVTSISAISFFNSPELVFGNILGSNIFNLSILASLIIVFFKEFLTNKVKLDHQKRLDLILCIYSLVFIKMQFEINFTIMNIDVISILIFLFYTISLKFISVNDEDDVDDKVAQSTEDVKSLLIKFIFFSMGLVISSVIITFLTDEIAKVTNMGETLAGALLLGVVTSIPELATSITLCKLGNFNGVFGNIIGSNIFNYIIISIGDVLYNSGSIYVVNNQSYKLVVFGFVATVLALIILKSKVKDENQTDVSLTSKVTYILSALFILASYGLFIFL